RADTADGLALGEDFVGALVALEREPARPLPRSLPLLRRLLHAALLDRARPGAGQHVRCLRALRRRLDSDQLPGDPACESADPPCGLYAAGAPDGRFDV